MRSTITFIIALCAATTVHAQEPYSHYLDSTCIWYESMAGVDFVGTTYSRLTIYVDGDTLLNGTPFFKQYYTRWDSTVYFTPLPPNVVSSGPNYYRALREDDQDRFWEWRNWMGTDVVINDFDLVVGDTFPDDDCPIDSMDVIFFNGDPLKHFLSAYSTIGHGVIEGIGSTGLLCATGIEGNWWWTCFSKQGHTLQIDPSGDCSVWPAPVYQYQIAMDVSDGTTRSRTRIYPNPASDHLTLEWPSGTVDELVLLNAQGAIVEQRMVPNSTSARLSVDRRSAGIYLLQLKKAGCIVERRSVIKD